MIDAMSTPQERREFCKYLSQPKFVRARRVNGTTKSEVIMHVCKREARFVLIFSVLWVLVWGFALNRLASPLSFLHDWIQILAYVAVLNLTLPVGAQWFWPQTFPTYGINDPFLKICWKVADMPEGKLKDTVVIAMADVAYSSRKDLRDARLKVATNILTDMQRKVNSNGNII